MMKLIYQIIKIMIVKVNYQSFQLSSIEIAILYKQ